MIDNKMSKKIYILGAGAIGGLIGARLTQKFGKENIILIDIDEEHIKAITGKGLRIFDKGRKIPQIETIDVNIATPDRVDKKRM
jgi:2-dehydropantoate 2-reductase